MHIKEKLSSIVIGDAGFSDALCDRLLKEGHEVVCIDNLLTGDTANIAQLAGNKNFNFIYHDVTNYIFIDGDVDFIYHFASPASPIDYLKVPIQTLKVGSLGTHKALGLAKTKKARFFLASTSEPYGDPLVHPQTEDWGNVNPVGDGAFTMNKTISEAITIAHHRYHGLETRIVRIFNTYGERMRVGDGRAIPAFLSQALRGEDVTVYGDGKQTRSVCYVSDLIDGNYKLMMSDYSMPMNIGNPDEVTMLDLAREIIELTKARAALFLKTCRRTIERYVSRILRKRKIFCTGSRRSIEPRDFKKQWSILK